MITSRSIIAKHRTNKTPFLDEAGWRGGDSPTAGAGMEGERGQSGKKSGKRSLDGGRIGSSRAPDTAAMGNPDAPVAWECSLKCARLRRKDRRGRAAFDGCGNRGSRPLQLRAARRGGTGDGRGSGREAETVQNFLNGFGRLDCGENPQRAATLRTLQDIQTAPNRWNSPRR